MSQNVVTIGGMTGSVFLKAGIVLIAISAVLNVVLELSTPAQTKLAASLVVMILGVPIVVSAASGCTCLALAGLAFAYKWRRSRRS